MSLLVLLGRTAQSRVGSGRIGQEGEEEVPVPIRQRGAILFREFVILHGNNLRFAHSHFRGADLLDQNRGMSESFR